MGAGGPGAGAVRVLRGEGREEGEGRWRGGGIHAAGEGRRLVLGERRWDFQSLGDDLFVTRVRFRIWHRFSR